MGKATMGSNLLGVAQQAVTRDEVLRWVKNHKMMGQKKGKGGTACPRGTWPHATTTLSSAMRHYHEKGAAKELQVPTR